MKGAWARRGCLVGLGSVLAWASLGQLNAPPAYGQRDAAPRAVFTIGSDAITESSALVVSSAHRGLVYTANDSGDAGTIYVLDADTGDVVGQTTLEGVDPVDIEGMAGGSDGSLVIADMGDNDSDRPSIAVYLIEQPGRGTASATAQRVTLTYTDGPRDAESVLYDARSGRVFVASKEFVGASVYRTSRDVFDRSEDVLTAVSAAPGLATDATYLPSGDFAVIRTYLAAVVYRVPEWRKVASIALPPQQQGESVAAPPGNGEIWVGSEGDNSTVLAVQLPDLTPEAPTSAPGAPASAPGSREAASPQRFEVAARAAVVGATGALALVVVIGVVRYRRRH